MAQKSFVEKQFVATQFDSAKDKAAFASRFARFVLSGFKPSLFTQKFYVQLSHIFGHIAHYDRNGFRDVWFSTPARQRSFIDRVREHTAVGQPEFCWVDVERELQNWVQRELLAIEAILQKIGVAFSAALTKEGQRRTALEGKAHQDFKVLARDDAIGPFGHNRYILRAEDGSTFLVHRNFMNKWAVGATVRVPLTDTEPNWARVSCEVPSRLPPAPSKAPVARVFGAGKKAATRT